MYPKSVKISDPYLPELFPSSGKWNEHKSQLPAAERKGSRIGSVLAGGIHSIFPTVMILGGFNSKPYYWTEDSTRKLNCPFFLKGV